MKTKKIFWNFLLLLNIIIFIIAILNHVVYLSILVIFLSALIRFKGNKFMYDKLDVSQQHKLQ